VVGRRLVILVAVLMGLMVLAASVAPPPQTPRSTGGRAGASPTPTASAPNASPAPSPGDSADALDPTHTLDVARGQDHVTVRQGQAMTLNVVADAVGSVEIVGLSEVAAVDPSTPAMFQLSADVPGHFPVKLAETGKPLGELIVTPAPAS
jgi:hypothetical protein